MFNKGVNNNSVYTCVSYYLLFIYYLVSTFFSVISRRSLGKVPVLLVRLSRHQPVSRNDNPTTLIAKEGNHYYHC